MSTATYTQPLPATWDLSEARTDGERAKVGARFVVLVSAAALALAFRSIRHVS